MSIVVELSQGSWAYSHGSLDQKCGMFILHFVYPVRKKEQFRGDDGGLVVNMLLLYMLTFLCVPSSRVFVYILPSLHVHVHH